MHPTVDLHEFLDLDVVDRQLLVERYGVSLGLVDTTLYRFELFAIGSFYAEVRSVVRRGDVSVQDIVPFVKGPRLDKYVESIDLSEWIGA